jgi:uncharacterized protein (TIGR02145 family)
MEPIIYLSIISLIQPDKPRILQTVDIKNFNIYHTQQSTAMKKFGILLFVIITLGAFKKPEQESGQISSLSCSAFQLSGPVVAGVAVSGVSLIVPYTGGNGGKYEAAFVSSYGITGLTALLDAASFADGNGFVVYQLSGTPSGAGAAFFALNLGGKSCNVSMNVSAPAGCGAFVAPGQWKTFMCHNLGAANTNADPFTPSWEINGGYWQWGRKDQAAAGPTGGGATQANADAITGWNTTDAPNGAWSDNTKTANDPCPTGFRVPTRAQWDAIFNRNLNTRSFLGSTWTTSATNYAEGMRIGSGTSGLFLPAAGGRTSSNGSLIRRGGTGDYWSTTKKRRFAWGLYFDTSYAYTLSTSRTYGMSVRCVAE